jgi:hypothetical protein
MPRLWILLALGAVLAVAWSRRGQQAITAAVETEPVRSIFDPIIESVIEPIQRIITNMTRGERNNNPGNIERTGENWQGMSADQSGDSRFIVFDSPEYGIRALGKLLQNYQRQGFNTISTIISRYAPGSENDTVAYINHVSAITGFAPDDPLDLNDPAALNLVIQAIITHENGRNVYAAETINGGITMIG